MQLNTLISCYVNSNDASEAREIQYCLPRAGSKRILRDSFGLGLDVIEDAQVDFVDDVIGPKAPVGLGIEVVDVPGGAFEMGFAGSGASEFELTGVRDEKAVEMRRIDLVRAEFAHGRRVGNHRKVEKFRLLPDIDRFNEGTGGKETVPNRAATGSADFSADRISNAGTEDEFAWRRNLGKGDNL